MNNFEQIRIIDTTSSFADVDFSGIESAEELIYAEKSTVNFENVDFTDNVAPGILKLENSTATINGGSWKNTAGNEKDKFYYLISGKLANLTVDNLIVDGDINSNINAIDLENSNLRINGSTFSNLCNHTVESLYQGNSIIQLKVASKDIENAVNVYEFIDTKFIGGGVGLYSRGIYAEGGKELLVSGCDFKDLSARYVSAGVAAQNIADVTFDNTKFSNNTTELSSYRGGGAVTIGEGWEVYHEKYDFKITNCSFIENSAYTTKDISFSSSYGGGAASVLFGFTGYYMSLSTVNIENNEFTGNKFSDEENDMMVGGGGALFLCNNSNGNKNNTATIKNNTFTGNIAENINGGAVYVWGMFVADLAADYIYIFDNNIFTDNMCSYGNGGALCVDNFDSNGEYWMLQNSQFNGNRSVVNGTQKGSSTFGGAIYCDNKEVTLAENLPTIVNTQFTDNYCEIYYENSVSSWSNAYGGAVYGRAAIYNCSFTGNQLKVTARNGYSKGGAVCFSGTAILQGSDFKNNGIVIKKDSSDYKKNLAGSGGAVYATESISISGSYAGNYITSDLETAGLRGGAIYLEKGGSFSNATFTNNKISLVDGSLAGSGGAIYSYGDVIFNIEEKTIGVWVGNQAKDGGFLVVTNYSKAIFNVDGKLTIGNNSGSDTIVAELVVKNGSGNMNLFSDISRIGTLEIAQGSLTVGGGNNLEQQLYVRKDGILKLTQDVQAACITIEARSNDSAVVENLEKYSGQINITLPGSMLGRMLIGGNQNLAKQSFYLDSAELKSNTMVKESDSIAYMLKTSLDSVVFERTECAKSFVGDGSSKVTVKGKMYTGIVCGTGVDVDGKLNVYVDLALSNTCNIYGGGNVSRVGEVALTVGGGDYTGLIYGGNRAGAGANSIVQNGINLMVRNAVQHNNVKLLNKGTSAWVVGGGNSVDGGKLKVGGLISMRLRDAELGSIVGGAQAQGDKSYAEVASTNILIRDCTIADNIYAGGYAYNGGTSHVAGDTFINFAAIANLSVMGNIFGGGANPAASTLPGISTVGGNSMVEFSGNGDVLTLGGYVSGDGRVAGSVAGVKTLAFSSFSGEFSATVKNFDVIRFAGKTMMSGNGQEYSCNNFEFDLKSRKADESAFLSDTDGFVWGEGDKTLKLVLPTNYSNPETQYYDLMKLDDFEQLADLRISLFEYDYLLANFNYGESYGNLTLTDHNGMLSLKIG